MTTADTVRAVLAAACLVSTGEALACECFPYTPEVVEKLFRQADAVVHAKVIALNGEREARLQIIEAFKGDLTVVRGRAAPEVACGWTFQPGDEELFFVHRGEVNMCTRHPVTGELKEQLRRLKR